MDYLIMAYHLFFGVLSALSAYYAFTIKARHREDIELKDREIMAKDTIIKQQQVVIDNCKRIHNITT